MRNRGTRELYTAVLLYTAVIHRCTILAHDEECVSLYTPAESMPYQWYAALHLQTDQHLGPFLDLYQIHSATLESGVLSAADVLEALAQLKAEKGWAIGLSVSGELLQQSFISHKKCCCPTVGLADFQPPPCICTYTSGTQSCVGAT
jgi:hypothetical protein